MLTSPRAGAGERGQNAQEGGFAGPVRSQQGHKFALRNLKIQVAQDGLWAKTFDQALDFNDILNAIDLPPPMTRNPFSFHTRKARFQIRSPLLVSRIGKVAR